MKKFFRLVSMLAVAGLAFAYTSCTDYSKDIDDNRSQIEALESTVKSLQDQISKGAVITNVTVTDSGIVVTTSDGKTYTITNGKDGAKGETGATGAQGEKGDKGDKGDTGAQGEKGDKGDKGDTGAQGEKGDKGDTGAAGKDGGFYTPGEDGYWYFHKDSTDKAGTKTEYKTLPVGTITAELSKDGKKLTLKGIPGYPDGFTFEINTTLSSLVFIPQVYVGGVEGMQFSAYYYNSLKGDKIDSENGDETWTTSFVYNEKTNPGYTPIKSTSEHFEHMYNNETIAEYHVNSNNIVLDSTFTYEFIRKDVPTKALSSDDFTVKADFVSFENDILKVKVTVTGTQAYKNYISVVALKAYKNTYSVVSDYATLWSDIYYDLRISKPFYKENNKTVDYHYRRLLNDIDGEAGNNTVVWNASDDLEAAAKGCDLSVPYNSSIDLKKYVKAHFKAEEAELTDDDMNKLNLTWDFALVKNFKIGKPETDQIQFANLENGVFTPKVYDVDGSAAIGRTPIVRVKLLHGQDVVAVAYIKVYIASTTAKVFELKPTVDVDGKPKAAFTYVCNGGDVFLTTVEDMNKELYNALGMSKDQFHTLYNGKLKIKQETGNDIGTVEDYVQSNGAATQATHVLKWTITADDLYNAYWKAIGAKKTFTSVSHVVKYVTTDEKLAVTVKLTANVEDLAWTKGYNVASANYTTNMWTSDLSATYYNVRTPNAGETSSDNCKLNVDINASFKQNADGRLAIPEYLTKTNVEYYFCKDMAVDAKNAPVNTTIGDITVRFQITGNILEAKKVDKDGNLVGTEWAKIASINNDGTNAKTGLNVFTYNKDSQLAKELLNTEKMYVLIGAKAYLCGDKSTPKAVNLTFNGKEHFRANVVRPVYVASECTESFIDGVNFGETGSFVNVKNIISPTDWRGYAFSKYPFLWEYYGITDANIKVDTKNVMTDLDSSDGKLVALKPSIVLKQLSATKVTVNKKDVYKLVDEDGSVIEGSSVPALGEYLTYRNNNLVVQKPFNIYVKVNVTYAWGTIATEWIKIPVAKTVGQ